MPTAYLNGVAAPSIEWYDWVVTMLIDRARSALRGRYEIEREVGRGGMAAVFYARDPRHDRPVAIKVLHPELTAAVGSERFLREVRITARLSHPHILPLLDSGESDGLLYFVMPLMEGESLRARLERSGPLPIEDALAIARQVADALNYAHGRGIVHRDIKPENILLESGHALVADFGIAHAVGDATAERITGTGIAVGTPLYMSPEQAEGRHSVDARSDLYSLGCVLYEMLAGAPPFSGPSAHAIVLRRLREPAPSVRQVRDSVPVAVDAAVRRALERIPSDRFQSGGELALALGPATAAPAAEGSPIPRWRTHLRAGTAAGLVLVAGLAWGAISARAPVDSNEVASIAVLPFVNMTSDTAQEYFADGLTDELITSLSRVEGLQVASRTSSFVFKRQNLDLREIGRRLNVQSVLEGSVLRGADRIRVSARLVAVADGYQRWSQNYDRNARDALSLQEEIARTIVDTLQSRLRAALADSSGPRGPKQDRGVLRALGRAAQSLAQREPASPGQARLPPPDSQLAVPRYMPSAQVESPRQTASPATPDAEAYDHYLRGIFFKRQATEDGLRRAIAHLDTAVARAPNFARAYTALAEAYAVLGFLELEAPGAVFPAAARAAREAVRIDPGFGPARTTLAYVAFYHDWDWSLADIEFRRAIELEPTYSLAHQWYANQLTVMGRFDEAERSARRAVELDPFRITTKAVVGWVLYYKGDYARAASELRDVLELDSTSELAHLWYGQTLEAMGRTDEAVRYFRRAVQLSGEGATYVAALARSQAIRGQHAEAERLLGRLEKQKVVPALEIAKVQLALGRSAEALRWLERAYQQRSHSMVFLRVDPQLASLRSNPAFEQLAKRVGL